jgi:hypothetical protein
MFCYWAQSAPPGAEAVRVPISIEGAESENWKIGSFQRASNRVVGLIYGNLTGQRQVRLELSGTGWAPGTTLKAEATGEEISFVTGEHTPLWGRTTNLTVGPHGAAILKCDMLKGFTTLKIEPVAPEQNVELLDVIAPQEAQVDEKVQALIVLRNDGRDEWRAGRVKLCAYDGGARPTSTGPIRGVLKSKCQPGDPAMISVTLPAQPLPGRANYNLRLWDETHGWIGPMFTVSVKIVDDKSPRKLVAHREWAHVRLKWFAPLKAAGSETYQIERADGFEQPFKPLVESKATEYVDTSVQLDKAYYYRVIAIDSAQNRSQPSNEDNARGLSQPRLYDAEILSHNVPSEMRIGDPATVTVKLRNTGSKTWDLSRPEGLQFWLQTAQLWGRQDDDHLSRYSLPDQAAVQPGETVTISFAYVAPRVGRFENHWVMRMAVPTKGRTTGWDEKVRQAWFGTPLLAETIVKPK